MSAASIPHLYVHVPFCAHRCGYCDFVTVTGHSDQRGRYVDALIRELDRHRPRPQTIFIGGGTPSLLDDRDLARLLAALPAAQEITVECNPETITPAKARALVEGGVTRISLGAQSFRPHLLRVLERRAGPETVSHAIAVLRAAGIENLNLDLIFGVPGQSDDDLRADLRDALAHAPEHVSYYELESKPGTRFRHRHGAELERQAEAMEGYYEAVVATLRDAGYRWYETANFCLPGRECRHNLGYWLGHEYLGLGVGAVSTIGLVRSRNAPSLARYLAAVEGGAEPPAHVEALTVDERSMERLMLGLRLDRPLRLDGLAGLVDGDACVRLEGAGLLRRGVGTLALTDRGRFLANDVVATVLR
ncbi:MAG TPA: radical SAM family heme chaperone HemW [Gaiellales bacterium]|jgi:oxygen-independent coproporphyrinogen-3 oxidase|nr:radical SAM family heme chaperone HemW [Gaiellales bacterium]